MRHHLPHNSTELQWSTWGVPERADADNQRIHRLGAATLHTMRWNNGTQPLLAMHLRLDQPDWAGPGLCTGASPQLDFPPSAYSHGTALPAPGSAGWQYAGLGKEQRYALLPAYPDLPVCVKFEPAILLPPMSTLQGLLNSTVAAEIYIADLRVAGFPLKAMQKTLYGATNDGVVCYSLPGTLVLDENEEQEAIIVSEYAADSDFSRILHPVKLRNSTSEAIQLQELCIHGSQLAIYRQGNHLISDRILVTFAPARVRMTNEGPPHKGLEVLAEASASGDDTVIERSMEVLRAITRM